MLAPPQAASGQTQPQRDYLALKGCQRLFAVQKAVKKLIEFKEMTERNPEKDLLTEILEDAMELGEDFDTPAQPEEPALKPFQRQTVAKAISTKIEMERDTTAFKMFLEQLKQKQEK